MIDRVKILRLVDICDMLNVDPLISTYSYSVSFGNVHVFTENNNTFSVIISRSSKNYDVQFRQKNNIGTPKEVVDFIKENADEKDYRIG